MEYEHVVLPVKEIPLLEQDGSKIVLSPQSDGIFISNQPNSPLVMISGMILTELVRLSYIIDNKLIRRGSMDNKPVELVNTFWRNRR